MNHSTTLHYPKSIMADAPQAPSLDQSTLHAPPFDREAVQAEMEDRWPHLFGPGLHVPLKVGITADLHQEACANGSQLSKRKIRLFLEGYCQHPDYLAKLIEGGRRFDINGLPAVEEVKGRHVKNATRRLALKEKRTKAGDAATPLQQPTSGE